MNNWNNSYSKQRCSHKCTQIDNAYLSYNHNHKLHIKVNGSSISAACSEREERGGLNKKICHWRQRQSTAITCWWNGFEQTVWNVDVRTWRRLSWSVRLLAKISCSSCGKMVIPRGSEMQQKLWHILFNDNFAFYIKNEKSINVFIWIL